MRSDLVNYVSINVRIARWKGQPTRATYASYASIEVSLIVSHTYGTPNSQSSKVLNKDDRYH